MKSTFASWEHSPIGWPKIKLKWSATMGTIDPEPYITIRGEIRGGWKWHNHNPLAFITFELDRFDEHVRKHYSDQTDLQG